MLYKESADEVTDYQETLGRLSGLLEMTVEEQKKVDQAVSLLSRAADCSRVEMLRRVGSFWL